MDNTDPLTLIESAIAEAEAELGKLSQLTDIATASRETIKKLEEDVADLHFNRGNLEPKVRSSRHVSATSLLTLERCDLEGFERGIDAQSDRAAQFGARATALLQELHAVVLAARKADIEEMVRRTFDLSKVRVPVEFLTAAAHTVLEVEEVGNILFQYRTADERDTKIDDARRLKARSAPLLEWARELPDLSLNFVDPGIKPVIKPQAPVVSGNVLGTLVASAA
jgi:hypothetical protein